MLEDHVNSVMDSGRRTTNVWRKNLHTKQAIHNYLTRISNYLTLSKISLKYNFLHKNGLGKIVTKVSF